MTSDAAKQRNSRHTMAGAVAVASVALVAMLVLGRFGGRYVPEFVARIRSFGALGPIVYVLGYTVAMVAGIPASVLTLARVEKRMAGEPRFVDFLLRSTLCSCELPLSAAPATRITYSLSDACC